MKSVSDLPPDEAHVVTQLRKYRDYLRPDPNGRMLLRVGHISVCTYDTLFRMLGRDVLSLDPEARQADRYELTVDWR